MCLEIEFLCMYLAGSIVLERGKIDAVTCIGISYLIFLEFRIFSSILVYRFGALRVNLALRKLNTNLSENTLKKGNSLFL